MGSLPEDPASIREMLLSSPRDLALLKERNPPLAEALLSGDLGKLQLLRDILQLILVKWTSVLVFLIHFFRKIYNSFTKAAGRKNGTRETEN